ncbi:probable phospholipid-transporting ATPase IA isoform X3 [Drosophila pseudoobscura]|uniref:Phospholipid-transporting ATPase n=1 Tax=Drosophila pseudoobscura pseudoobscura TaxID=46245 RepID=A0A6I8V7S2_DROPS|nr:probable phospholipid-transporting ATPase IA isoform X3 [Drosophila pseudoobscura]
MSRRSYQRQSLELRSPDNSSLDDVADSRFRNMLGSSASASQRRRQQRVAQHRQESWFRHSMPPAVNRDFESLEHLTPKTSCGLDEQLAASVSSSVHSGGSSTLCGSRGGNTNTDHFSIHLNSANSNLGFIDSDTPNTPITPPRSTSTSLCGGLQPHASVSTSVAGTLSSRQGAAGLPQSSHRSRKDSKGSILSRQSLAQRGLRMTTSFLRRKRKEYEDDEDITSSAGYDAEDGERRVIILNGAQPVKYCNNRISTAKYNIISFLPSFLFEQFRRYSNCFFLLIALLQQIPDVSPTGRYTTLVPLMFILSVSAVKEIIEDVKRHRADNEINHRPIERLENGTWSTVRWAELTVGDIIKVSINTFFPADLIILSSSEPQAMCFIETANLDGETNLKIRQGVTATAGLLETKDLSMLQGRIECELPNRHLYEFNGVLKEFGKQSVSLGNDQVLQRGAMLRNTAWVFGVVVYSGQETKLMKNSTSAPLKRSTVDKLTNTQILMLFMILISLCITSGLCNLFWTREHSETDWYLGLSDFKSLSLGYNLLTFFILYNNLIPISLQVTLELVRFLQAIFINYDIEMYHEPSDTPAMARTSNLNEELGMVKYIFSDKTGTLTQNVMVFKKCSIAGHIYAPQRTPEESLLVQNILRRHESAEVIEEFLVLLSVCHTVIPERSDESIIYHAASPDERALVEGAHFFGYIFDTRTPEYVEINALGQRRRYQVLNVLEFTSARKRMSLIVRTPEGKIKLFCKGADSVIYERLSAQDRQYRDRTLQHLEEFASEGLRTLCLAVADIQPDVYEEWRNTYHKAATALQHRERKLEDAADLIEINLRLLGATAIEDRLQDGVPETIAALMDAGIYIWVLTGDKQETAINIGYSCRLISHTMDILILNEESLDATRDVILRHLGEFKSSTANDMNVALVIDGTTLKYALSCDLRGDFQELCLLCRVVICCRVSPMQKAEVVEMVTQSTKAVTLAIGDGANDVAMIQKANVGIGISGVEGLQAACASDYSIAQFRYLQRLLLVHGAWNYARISKLILYSFYKNVCLYVIELWFALYSGWSGQILFERWTIGLYNVLFTAMPPFAMGLFEKFCTAETMLKYPMLYKPSQNAKLFNVKVFWIWIFNALLHSVFLFWLPMAAYSSDTIWRDGKTNDYLMMGNMVYTYVIVTVCLKAGLITNSWTWLTHMAIWGSIVLWFGFVLIYSHCFPTFNIGSNFPGMDIMMLSTPVFYLGLVLVPITTLLIDVICKLIHNTVFKTLTEAVRETEIRRNDLAEVMNEPRSSFTETARLLRNVFTRRANTRVETELELSHGYAFSQEEGGAVPQSIVIRAYDTNLPKPEGN